VPGWLWERDPGRGPLERREPLKARGAGSLLFGLSDLDLPQARLDLRPVYAREGGAERLHLPRAPPPPSLDAGPLRALTGLQLLADALAFGLLALPSGLPVRLRDHPLGLGGRGQARRLGAIGAGAEALPQGLGARSADPAGPLGALLEDQPEALVDGAGAEGEVAGATDGPAPREAAPLEGAGDERRQAIVGAALEQGAEGLSAGIEEAGDPRVARSDTLEGRAIEEGALEVGTVEGGVDEGGAAQIGATQVGALEVGPSEVGALEVGPLEDRAPQVGVSEPGAAEVGPLEVDGARLQPVGLRTREARSPQPRAVGPRAVERGAFEDGLVELRADEIGAAEVAAHPNEPVDPQTAQVEVAVSVDGQGADGLGHRRAVYPSRRARGSEVKQRS
jgi:hypothetical protein